MTETLGENDAESQVASQKPVEVDLEYPRYPPTLSGPGEGKRSGHKGNISRR